MWTYKSISDGNRSVELSDGVISFKLYGKEPETLWALLALFIGESTAFNFQYYLVHRWRNAPIMAPMDLVTVDEENPDIFIICLWRCFPNNSSDQHRIEYRISRESAEDLWATSKSITEDDVLANDEDGEDEEGEGEEEEGEED